MSSDPLLRDVEGKLCCLLGDPEEQAHAMIVIRNAIKKAIEEERNRTCEWVDEDDYWSTSCKQDYCFIDGGPVENRQKFCGYCGGKLVVVRKEEDK